MDSLKTIVEKINKKIGDSNYYYISKTAEHGAVLSDYIKNIKFICSDNNSFSDYLINEGNDCTVFSEFKSSSELLRKLSISNYKPSSTNYIQTFKISSQFEKQVSKIGAKQINTSALLNRQFEGKISQAKLFLDFDISIPRTLVNTLKNLSYEKLVNDLGTTFVIQFNRGHTGSGTKFINSKADFNELLKIFPKREVRVSKFVTGKTYTLNCCMTKYGILAGGISEQITGIPELTSEKGGTVGNNFYHDLSQAGIELLKKEFEKMKKMFEENKYMGLFGIDFIYNSEENRLYIIEINARQTMSVNFHGELQLENNQIPLLFFHIAEFLEINYKVDIEKYNKAAMKPISAGQLYLRKKTEDDLEIGKDVILNDGIELGNIVLLKQNKGSIIKKGGEIARIQTRKNIVDGGTVNKTFINLLLQIEK